MNNYLAKGRELITVAGSSIASGAVVLVNNVVGISNNKYNTGDTAVIVVRGAFQNLAKNTGEAWSVGQPIYWNATASNFTIVAGGNYFAGYAYTAQLSADATGSVLLAPEGAAPLSFGLAAAAGTTGTVAQSLANVSALSITPTGNVTLNATGGVAGQTCAVVVTTSGTSSFTITFGTGFKSTGTLATGTTTAKVFTVTFVFDSVNWNEISRTAAM